MVHLKLQLHDAIYGLRFYSNSLIHILSLSNSHNNVASLQKNRGDKSHRVIVALSILTHASESNEVKTISGRFRLQLFNYCLFSSCMMCPDCLTN